MRARLTVVGESCPVCGSEATRGQATSDAVQIRCPRCGPFKITGTALAMLTSRLEGNERSRARTSYAIRSTTSEDHWLEIDSTSVDKLVGSDLPPLERQVDNFFKWMSDELGDDQMGTVQLPENLDHLAGVVGAVDGERIEALVGSMQKEGLIDLISNNCVRLTMAAWNRLDPPPIQTQNPHTSLLDENEGSSEPTLFDYPGAEAVFPLEEIIQAHCPNCGPYRKADVLTRHIEHQLGAPEHSDTLYRIEDYRILKCRGCEAIYVQRLNVLLNLDLMGEQDFDPKTGEYDSGIITSATTSWPAPSQRKPPGWLVEIQDEVLRGLLEEVYEALGADLRSIAAMGIRAALDRTFELAGANPAHGFAQKLAALEAQNVIAAKEKELLLIMTDAGSAASHRGWKPEPEQLDTILAATEGLLQRVALLGPAAKKIKDEIPPRPERPKK